MSNIKTFCFKPWLDFNKAEREWGTTQYCDIGEYTAVLFLDLGNDGEDGAYDKVHISISPRQGYGGDAIFEWEARVSNVTVAALYQEAIDRANRAWKFFVMETFFEEESK